jgi:flagellar protein FlaG
MSSETIVNALFLISAVIAAGILISAVFPAIYRTAETFGSASHEADVQMRTDFKIVNLDPNSQPVHIWVKNTGSARIAKGDLDSSDLFIGTEGDFERVSLMGNYTIPNQIPENNFWNPGETLEISVQSEKVPTSDPVYCLLVLANGMRREY